MLVVNYYFFLNNIFYLFIESLLETCSQRNLQKHFNTNLHASKGVPYNLKLGRYLSKIPVYFTGIL